MNNYLRTFIILVVSLVLLAGVVTIVLLLVRQNMNREIDYDKELEDAAFAFNPPYMVLTEEDKKKPYEMAQMIRK